jgi:hypothetical protein
MRNRQLAIFIMVNKRFQELSKNYTKPMFNVHFTGLLRYVRNDELFLFGKPREQLLVFFVKSFLRLLMP